ncbi:MAG TPA: molybdopterin cofactor-binding domain-containing protein, partial [Candidatus Binatia bacterium]|nr:molybdopterin cofactor-binding domain-containing protein [Candidatus Binatia bacterium]
FGVRSDVAEQLGVPEDRIQVAASWVGGGFGGKGSSLLEPYALLLAAAADRPVKLALGYAEEFRLARSTLPARVHLETAVRGGRMVARRVRLLLDSGASLPGRDFATGYSIGFLLGPYRYEAFEVEGYAVRTHKVPFGPHRAPLAPQCAFAAESHVDGIARRLGVDPIAFRRAHVWAEGDRTMFGQPVGPTGLAEALDRAAERAAAWRRGLPAGHGVGVGVGFWSTGVGAGGEARLRLGPQRLRIEVGERDIGSGSVVRGLPAVAERVLGLPADRIEVVYGSTATAPYDTGVFGSRTVGALGQAVQRAAEAIQRLLAERLGGGTPSALRLRAGPEGLAAVLDGRSAPVARLLTDGERDGGLVTLGKHYGGGGGLDESRVDLGEFYPYSDITGSVHIAEVEVDRETGRVRPVRCAAFVDVGVVIDAEMFRGQVEGAVAMGLGEALTEETVFDANGRLTNAQLLDYRIPTLAEVPPIEAVAIEGHPGAGPFGAKGLGEPPIIPVPAAVANAVADATGARLSELPMTPERVARALKLPD